MWQTETARALDSSGNEGFDDETPGSLEWWDGAKQREAII